MGEISGQKFWHCSLKQHTFQTIVNSFELIDSTSKYIGVCGSHFLRIRKYPSVQLQRWCWKIRIYMNACCEEISTDTVVSLEREVTTNSDYHDNWLSGYRSDSADVDADYVMFQIRPTLVLKNCVCVSESEVSFQDGIYCMELGNIKTGYLTAIPFNFVIFSSL